ncbi:MAG TPA: sigma-70 family RNA polymerase sigma factor [Acidimicrobiales bacterium]
MALQPRELSAMADDVDLDRDRALVQRCQSGDASAFGELYSRYFARVYRFCFRRLHDHEEAEDVAQDAFARAWRALPNFGGERRFYPWLTVIADNRCRDIQRRRVRSMPTPDVDIAAKQAAEPLKADTPEDSFIASVEGDLALQALARLSPRHRQVLSLREGSGWTYQEIASHEGVEIRTVESLIWRARQALKREYASIASVNGVIGGIALGRWGALRRAGGSLARRAHLAGAVLNSTGGARGLATAVALTSFAVVAAALPGSSQPEHHSVAAVDPAGEGGRAQPGPTDWLGDSAAPLVGGSVVSGGTSTSGGSVTASTSPTSPTAPDQATVSPSANGSSATGGGALPAPTNPVISPPSFLPLPVTPTGSAPAPVLPTLNQPTDPATTIPSLPSVPSGSTTTTPSLPLGSNSLTTPVEGLLGVN